MKVLCRLAQVVACGLIVACLAPATFGALELRMAPLTRTVDGLPGPVDVDFFIVWDGAGSNLISSINFDVVMPASITLPDRNPNADPPTPAPPNPFGFSLASVVANSVAFTDFAGNKTLVAGQNSLLTTLTFETTRIGRFPIELRLVEAGRGGALNFEDITAEFTTVSGGVILVPEPSSLAILGLVSVGGFCLRRRR